MTRHKNFIFADFALARMLPFGVFYQNIRLLGFNRVYNTKIAHKKSNIPMVQVFELLEFAFPLFFTKEKNIFEST
jgi:hypothetical protein